jgi:hypothetical protein
MSLAHVLARPPNEMRQPGRVAGVATLMTTCLLASLLLAPTRPAFAQFVQTQVNADALARASFAGPAVVDPNGASSDLGGLVSTSSFAQSGPATASADAAAALGFLRGQAFNTFPVNSGATLNNLASATAQASWSDSWTINIPGQIGQVAQFTALAFVDGFIDVVGDARAEVRVTATRNGISLGSTGDTFLADGPLDGNGQELLDVMLISGSFVVGTPFQFAMTLGVTVDRNPGGDGTGSADVQFGDTVTWGGITGISLGGQTVGAFDFASLSGLDFIDSFVSSEPPTGVPEPGCIGLVTAGLLGLATVRRRLHRRHAM